MSTTAPQIFRWRDQVKADRRLKPIDFLVAFQLSEKTNAREFGRSGTLVTWQGIPSMAAAIGVSERTVQRSIRRLQKKPKHIELDPGGGRHHANRYTLFLRPVQAVAAADDKTETVTAVSGFPKNGDSRVTLSRETVTNLAGNGDKSGGKRCQPCHPNPSIRDFSNPSADPTDTEPAGPRQRADALGPPPETETGQRLTNGHALQAAEPEPPAPPAPLKSLGPLAGQETELRDLLAERFRVLAMGQVIELTPDGALVIKVPTPNTGHIIRRDCETDLLGATGARELKFVIGIATEPPPLRRMP